MDIDEDALNVLLSEGVDLPTALAGSVNDQPASPRRNVKPAIVGILAVVFYIVLRLLI